MIMKTQSTNLAQPGDNHTGIALHPEYADEMLKGTKEFGPTSGGGPELIAENRVRVAAMSTPVGTMPPVSSVPTEHLVLLDKLGARLQFERTGTRLYEALISKLDAYGTFEGGPSREDLLQIRDEEHEHMQLVQALIVQIGGDPTVVTPCANLQAVASRGIGEVLMDPRTTLLECLDAILVAEMTDHESWELLVTLAAPTAAELEAKLQEAQETEAEHLVKVRAWLAAGSLEAQPKRRAKVD
jgi:rubrerythrin